MHYLCIGSLIYNVWLNLKNGGGLIYDIILHIYILNTSAISTCVAVREDWITSLKCWNMCKQGFSDQWSYTHVGHVLVYLLYTLVKPRSHDDKMR